MIRPAVAQPVVGRPAVARPVVTQPAVPHTVDSGRPGDLSDAWVAAASCRAPSTGPHGRLAFVGDRGG
ncbi:hypothetical protein, partial [Frankia sp. CcWB3]